MRSKILVIDDEPRYLRVYLQELHYELQPKGYMIEFCRDLDRAYEFLLKERDNVAIVILDIMMPIGKRLEKEETVEGLHSGIVFYLKVIREELKLTDLPVILFTNLPANGVRQELHSERKCFVMEKIENLPFELCNKVKEILGLS